MNMIPPEFTPILIEAHQSYLRSLGVEYDKVKEPTRRSRRQAAGELLVRFGHWLGGHSPDRSLDPAPATANTAGCA